MVCVVLVSWFIVDVQRLLDTSFFWILLNLTFDAGMYKIPGRDKWF